VGSGLKWIPLPPPVAVPGFDDPAVPLPTPQAGANPGNLAAGGHRGLAQRPRRVGLELHVDDARISAPPREAPERADAEAEHEGLHRGRGYRSGAGGPRRPNRYTHPPMVGMDRRIPLAWLCVAAWIAVILSVSSEPFSAQATAHFFVPFLRWLDPEMNWATIRAINAAIRKTAHVTEYAVLAALAFRAFRVSLDVRLGHVGLLTLGVVLAVAGLDELRQSWLPARTGSLTDVVIDLTGGAIGVALLIGFHRWLGVRRPTTRTDA